jgi:hypothetical protein
MRDRPSSIISGRHPNFDRTIAISFAMFWASGSPGTTYINIFVPAHRSNPANHFFAGGSWSNPISPTCLGSMTVCSARLSPFKCSVSLFNAAIFLLEARRSYSQLASLTSAVFTMTNVEITPPTRLASNTQLAMLPNNVAAASDISENGHIRIPGWFLIGGIF